MSANTKPAPNTNLKLVIGFSFVLIGVVSVLLGQILPILSARFSLNDAQAGTFFFAQFSGSLIGTLLSGRLSRSFGFAGILALGFALMIAGLPLLNFHTYFVCWLAVFLYGMGTGFAIPAGNLLTIETTSLDRQAAAVNLINFCWGAGAILCQPFVAAVSGNGSLVFVSWPIASMFVATLVTLLSFQRISPAKADENEPSPMSIWREPFAWTFALFSFLIIGIEAGLSGWLTTYSNLLQAEGALSINAAFVYFGSFVTGRALASLVSNLISDNTLIAINTSLLLVGIVLLAIGSRETALPGAILVGLGTSAIFPTHMVRFSKIFGPSATQQATPIFVFAILGAASTSWLIGFISTWSGSLRNGIALLLAAAALLATLQIVISRIYKASAAL